MSLSWQEQGIHSIILHSKVCPWLIYLCSSPNALSTSKGSQVASEVENIVLFWPGGHPVCSWTLPQSDPAKHSPCSLGLRMPYYAALGFLSNAKELNLSAYIFTSQPRRHIGIDSWLFATQSCASCQAAKTLQPSIIVSKRISLCTFCCPRGD